MQAKANLSKEKTRGDAPEPKAPRAVFATLLCDRRQDSLGNAYVRFA